MDSARHLAGGIPMLNIDGARIRQIREGKGLTQLYIATVVGVTTDTISRWENHRYPSIKKENALKLAEALEIKLDEIIDHDPPAVSPDLTTSQDSDPTNPHTSPALNSAKSQTVPPTMADPSRRRLISRPVIILSAIFILLVLGGFTLRFYQNTNHNTNHNTNQVTAFRILPEHATPGIPFPVVIEVTTIAFKPFSLILTENLPPDGILAQDKPQFIFQTSTPSVLKLISKISGEHAVYSYLAKLKPRTKINTAHQFTGEVTISSNNKEKLLTAGNNLLKASAFHWADSNSDGRIDDKELLAVHEIYGGIKELRIGKKLIEEIWAAKGYRWNSESHSYEIIH